MSLSDLKQIATVANIDIKSLKQKAQLLKAIKSVQPPFPKKYNLIRNKWSSDPADATEPSTAAHPTEEEEEAEAPRNDTATEIQICACYEYVSETCMICTCIYKLT